MNLVFIVNEKSGNGNGAKIWAKLAQELTIPYELMKTTYEKQAVEYAAQLAATVTQPTLVVGIGGDGTYHEILNGLNGATQILVGAVCAGSGNDFKRAYYEFESAAHIEQFLKNPQSLKKDLGTIETANAPIYFVNNSGIGFDATVAITANESKVKDTFNKWKLGKLSYVYYLIKCLFTFKPFDLTVSQNGVEKHYSRVWFVTASNQPFFGGGMNISPTSNTEDELLELTVVHNLNKYKLLFIFGTVFFGKHTGFKEIDQLQAKSFSIRMKESYLMHADGEKLPIDTANGEIVFTVAEQKWQLANMNDEKRHS